MRSASAGTPGKATTRQPLHERQNPGADPTGLTSTSAPDGMSAWRSWGPVGVRPHSAKRRRMLSMASGRRRNGRPVRRATACLVQSSRVGPNPPVRTTTLARRAAVRIAAAMSASTSPTTDLNRTSTPTEASCSVRNNELVSSRPPRSNSDPIAMISPARMGISRPYSPTNAADAIIGPHGGQPPGLLNRSA